MTTAWTNRPGGWPHLVGRDRRSLTSDRRCCRYTMYLLSTVIIIKVMQFICTAPESVALVSGTSHAWQILVKIG